MFCAHPINILNCCYPVTIAIKPKVHQKSSKLNPPSFVSSPKARCTMYVPKVLLIFVTSWCVHSIGFASFFILVNLPLDYDLFINHSAASISLFKVSASHCNFISSLLLVCTNIICSPTYHLIKSHFTCKHSRKYPIYALLNMPLYIHKPRRQNGQTICQHYHLLTHSMLA